MKKVSFFSFIIALKKIITVDEIIPCWSEDEEDDDDDNDDDDNNDDKAVYNNGRSSNKVCLRYAKYPTKS